MDIIKFLTKFIIFRHKVIRKMFCLYGMVNEFLFENEEKITSRRFQRSKKSDKEKIYILKLQGEKSLEGAFLQYFYRGIILNSSDKHDEVIDEIKQAIDLAIEDTYNELPKGVIASCYLMLGNSRLSIANRKDKNYNEVLDYYENCDKSIDNQIQLQQSDFSSLKAQVNFGIALCLLGDLGAELTQGKVQLTNISSDPDKKLDKIIKNLKTALSVMGNVSESRDRYEKILNDVLKHKEGLGVRVPT